MSSRDYLDYTFFPDWRLLLDDDIVVVRVDDSRISPSTLSFTLCHIRRQIRTP